MQGVTEWTTPEGVYVLRLHYTADPRKRTEEWKKEAKRGMRESDWRQEYEIDFDVPIGKPYYPEFRSDFHVASDPIEPLKGKPIAGGWDYGLTPATVHLQVSPKGQIIVLHPEIQSWDAGIQRHGGDVLLMRKTHFQGYSFTDYGDPAGNQRVQTDKRTCNEILLQNHGISVIPGPVSQAAREEPFRDLLTRTTPQGSPMFYVDPRCHWLIAALSGGYCHKEVSGVYSQEPEKNDYSHIVDALLYAVAELLRKPERRKRTGKKRLSGQL